MQLLNLFKKKKAFSAGETTLEFSSKLSGEYADITYRKPTGEEMISYSYAALDLEKSDLKTLSAETLSAEMLHRKARKEKFHPFAKLVITRIDGYEENTFDFVQKYFPHHLESVANYAYGIDDKVKKKV